MKAALCIYNLSSINSYHQISYRGSQIIGGVTDGCLCVQDVDFNFRINNLQCEKLLTTVRTRLVSGSIICGPSFSKLNHVSEVPISKLARVF